LGVRLGGTGWLVRPPILGAMEAADRSRSPFGHGGLGLGHGLPTGGLDWGRMPIPAAGFPPLVPGIQPALQSQPLLQQQPPPQAPFWQLPPARPRATPPPQMQPPAPLQVPLQAQLQPQAPAPALPPEPAPAPLPDLAPAQPLRFSLLQTQSAPAAAGMGTAAPAFPVQAASAPGAVAAVAAAAPAAPPAEAPLDPQERERREQEEANARLKRSIENNEGYFEPRLGHVLMSEESRYTVVSNAPLGVGVFSVVWPCADKDNKLIALKVVRSQDHFRRFANKEVETLRRMKEMSGKDPEGAVQVATLRDHFVHSCTGPQGDVEHLCMAFEKLEQNLRSIGKQPLEKVLAFSKQLLVALRYLHDGVGLVHCDVKPDNLLLRWDGLAVKLCDFGTARFSPELQQLDELQPLFYRAPEVFIGSTRGRKIDLWSAGCTMYELVVGRILFRSCNTNREIVEKMMKLRGPVPKSMREQGRLAVAYFSAKGFHPEVGEPVDPDRAYKKTPMLGELAPFTDFGKVHAKIAQDLAKAQLSKLIGRTTVLSAATKKSGGPSEGERKLRALADLLERCMEMDPSERITAAAACEHDAMKAVALPPHAELQEAPPLPEEAPPPLPPQEPADGQ